MASQALSVIEEIASERKRLHEDPRKLAALERLQGWQVDRLRRTYDDYYRHERYREALDFFTRDLYAPHALRERDSDLRKVMGTWSRLLPERGLTAITQALELESLSLQLDLRVAEALAGETITEARYANAYRQANRRSDRERQISLILAAGRSLDELIGLKWVSTALRVARRPAKLAGVTELHTFLERGYAAFAKMGNADELLQAIEVRETEILRRLFENAPHPFDVTPADARTRRTGQ